MLDRYLTVLYDFFISGAEFSLITIVFKFF